MICRKDREAISSLLDKKELSDKISKRHLRWMYHRGAVGDGLGWLSTGGMKYTTPYMVPVNSKV